MSGIPLYSEQALLSRDIFFEGIADIHFFVEDEDLENVYETVVSKLFPRLKQFQIFPLKGKTNVLAHAKSVASVKGGATKVYVLDKDFDDVLGNLFVREDIFYLDDYSIESSIIDEKSLVQVCVEERPRVRRNELKGRLAYGDVLVEWFPLLDRLHRAFAIVQKFALGLPNTDLAPERFTLELDRSTLSAGNIEAYVSSVRDALLVVGEIDGERGYEELSRTIFSNARINRRHINGKFLSRLHYHRLRRSDLVSNITQDSFLMRCASSSDLNRMQRFKSRLNRYFRTKGRM